MTLTPVPFGLRLSMGPLRVLERLVSEVAAELAALHQRIDEVETGSGIEDGEARVSALETAVTALESDVAALQAATAIAAAEMAQVQADLIVALSAAAGAESVAAAALAGLPSPEELWV